MAQSFTVTSHNAEYQVLGPTNVLPVMKVGFQTKPTGIILEFPVPRDTWPTAALEIIETVAAGVEQMVSEGFAVGGEYAQDFDGNTGLLVDFCDFLVRWRDPTGYRPDMTATGRVPLSWFAGAADPFAFGLIADAEQVLQNVYDGLATMAQA